MKTSKPFKKKKKKKRKKIKKKDPVCTEISPDSQDVLILDDYMDYDVHGEIFLKSPQC